jgi:hypothetical protein
VPVDTRRATAACDLRPPADAPTRAGRMGGHIGDERPQPGQVLVDVMAI